MKEGTIWENIEDIRGKQQTEIFINDKMIQSENESYTLKSKPNSHFYHEHLFSYFTQLNPKKMLGLFINYTDAQLQNRI